MRWDPINFKRILFRAMSVPFFFGLCLYCLLYFPGEIISEMGGGKPDLLLVVCLAVFADLWEKEFSGSSLAVRCRLHVWCGKEALGCHLLHTVRRYYRPELPIDGI